MGLNRKTVSGITITLLLISMLTLAFSIQQVEALPEVVLSDKEIIPNPGYTSNIAFTATVSSPTTTNIWFQIKATLNETGLRFSQCVEDVSLEDSTRLTIEWVLDPLDPRFDRLPTIVGTTIYMVDWFGDDGGNSTNQGLPPSWVYGITTVYDDWEYALTGYLSEIAPQAPPSPTPQEALEEFIETLRSWDLPKGIENSLKTKLKVAIHMLDLGKEDGAIRKLTAFINRVEMLREKTLTNEQADYLIAEAQRIRDLING